MLDLQQASVADRIADLRREGDALRAERTRDHLREHTTTRTHATDHPVDLPSRRVRLGRWLVSIGVAIAGTGRPAVVLRSVADDPCADEARHLQSAA